MSILKSDSNVLGCHVTDRVTGFKGVVVGQVQYLTGCAQALVVPAVGSDGSFRDGQWIDDQRLQLAEGERVVIDNGTSPGADRAPPRSF